MPNKPLPQDDPFKGLKSGSWTRWGGARNGLIRASGPTWCCQLCAEDQPKHFPGFFVRDVESGEHVKVCAKCFALARQQNYSFRQVLVQLRGHCDSYDLEIRNLLTAWESR